MKQSQRHTGRARERPPGRGVRSITIFAVALIAAAASLLSFENQHTANEVAASLPVDCERYSMSRSECRPSRTGLPATALNDILHGQEQPVTDAPRLEQDRSPRRAWQQPEQVAKLRPGYTLVELCSHSPDLAVTYCDAHSTNDLYSLTGAGGIMDDLEGPYISGRVISAQGETLEGVSIVALPERLEDDTITLSENLRFWTTTDAQGAYSFDGIPAGEYMLRSARHGIYQPARVSARTGTEYADLVMHRNLNMNVEGRVVGSFGEPLEGVTVSPALLGQGSVQTGRDGRFELPLSVRPGVASLTLRFQMAGYQDQSSKIQIGGYPQPATEEIKVSMDMVESWTSLKGTVVDDAGRPLAGRRVELRPRAGKRTQITTTDSSGRYAFAFVEAPADYRLVVPGDNRFKDIERDVRVTSNGKELGVVAEQFKTGEVVGRLVNQNGFPIADFELVLNNLESGTSNVEVRTDSLGNFKIPAAPAGDLVFSSLSTPSILAKGLHLLPGEQIHTSMIVDWGDHWIRGQVVDSAGNPVPASRVVLNWSHRDELLDTHTTRRTATDAQGRFAFNNLGPGPHSLKVDAPGFSGVDIDHDLSRQGYDLTVRLN